MLRIYITRHGETEWNIQKRMQGWKDSNLTRKGEEYAIALGRRLKDVDFNCIYSSSSGRTIHTSELIRGDKDIRIIPDDNLREIHLGEWEGKTSTEIDDKQRLKAFWETPQFIWSLRISTPSVCGIPLPEIIGSFFTSMPVNQPPATNTANHTGISQ